MSSNVDDLETLTAPLDMTNEVWDLASSSEQYKRSKRTQWIQQNSTRMDIGAGLMLSELKIEYIEDMKPVSATCGGCGENMPTPPAEVVNSADIIMWLSKQYVDHCRQKHSQDDRRRIPRD